MNDIDIIKAFAAGKLSRKEKTVVVLYSALIFGGFVVSLSGFILFVPYQPAELGPIFITMLGVAMGSLGLGLNAGYLVGKNPHD